MTTFVVAPLFGALANAVVAVLIFLRSPQQKLSQVYLGWGGAVVLWCAGAGAMFLVHSEAAALRWATLLHGGVVWIPVTGLHVCLLVTDSARTPGFRAFLRICYGATVLLTLFLLTGHYIAGVRRMDYGWFASAGVGFWIFSGFLPVATLPAVFALYRRRQRVDIDQRRRYTILIAANALLLTAGTHDLMPVLGWSAYPGTSITIFPWGTYAAGLYGLMVGYGVLQDQILDVRVTLSQWAAHLVRIGFFCAIALLLLIIAGLLAPPGGMTHYSFEATLVVIVVSASLAGFFFPKLFGAVGGGFERRILGDRFEYHEQIVAVADSIHRQTSLRAAWQQVSDVLHGAMALAPVHGLFLGPRRFANPVKFTSPAEDPSSAALGALTTDSALLAFLQGWRKPLDARYWSAESKAACVEAVQLNAEYVFPLLGAERVIGFIAVGRKMTRRPITAHDLELLSQLAQRVAWATERTLLAEQAAFAERHELLALMSRGLAHDLNNLLTPVNTILQLSRRSIARGTPEESLLGLAESSLRHVRDYVEEAIIFAKDLRPRMTDVPIEEILSESKGVVHAKADRRGVTVITKGSPDTIRVDCVLCQRLLSNLLSNAIDASHKGQSVELLAAVDASKGIVRFTVRDYGVGIPQEDLPKIWQPYFTTKDSGEGEERGFGLGLAVCQLLVELHQGTISLNSIVSSGTTVVIELPKEGAGQPSWVPQHYVS